MPTEAGRRSLRLALVLGDTVLGDRTFDSPRDVVLGFNEDAVFPLPDGVVNQASLPILAPSGDAYQLALHPAMRGAVWMTGARRDLAELRGQTERVLVGPDDYGVILIGPVAIFFQMVAQAPPLRAALAWSGMLGAALGLSALLHAAVLTLLFLAPDVPSSDSLELPPELVRRFMVTPPPEDLLEERESSGGVESPELHEREEEAGGRAAPEEAGRVGREEAQQAETEIQGEVNGGAVAQRVSHLGLLGAIRGGEGQASALSEALQGPSIADLVGGLGSARTVMGRGAGGLSLRGGGAGGGGNGPGSLLGAGRLGTKVGAGRGAGRGGRGSGRGGGRGGGRGRGEVRVQMRTARPQVNGYLSAEQIMRVVRRNQAAVRYCYENELQRQPNLRGRIEIQWRIARNGSVSSARVGRSTMRNARVEGCIVRQVRRWRFDQPDGGEVRVNFPFLFGGG